MHKAVSQSDSNYSLDSVRSNIHNDRISEEQEIYKDSEEKQTGKDLAEDSSRPSTKLSKVFDSQMTPSKTDAGDFDKLSDKRRVYSSSEDEQEEKPLQRNNATVVKRQGSAASKGSKVSAARKSVTPSKDKKVASGKMNDSLSTSSGSESSEDLSEDAHDSDLSDSSSRTMTPIEKASIDFEALTTDIRLGDVNKIKAKLDEKPELINLKDHMGQSLAILASIRGNNEILKLIIGKNKELVNQPSITSKYFKKIKLKKE